MIGSRIGPPPRPPRPPENYSRPRDVRGNIVGLWGHVMARPGSDWRHRQDLEMRRRLEEGAGQLARDRLHEARLMEFLEVGSIKTLKARAHLMASAALHAERADLDRRRDALQELFISDGLREERELDELAQRETHDRMEEAKKRAAQLRQQREDQRLLLVQQKLEQQDRERMEVLRKAEIGRNKLNCREINLGQMKDKQERAMVELEETRLYNDVLDKTIKAQMEQEEVEAKEVLARQKATCEALKKQVEMRRQRDDQQRDEEHKAAVQEIINIREDVRKQRLAEEERRRVQRITLQKAFQEQIKERQRVLAREADKASAVEESVARETRKKEEQEGEKVQQENKARNAAEQKLYMMYNASLRAQLDANAKAEERARDEIQQQRQKEQDERRCRVKAAQSKILQETLTGRTFQLELKRQEKVRQSQEVQDEARKIEADLQEHRRQQREIQQRLASQRKQYADDLRSQMQYRTTLSQRAQDEEQRQIAQGLRDEEAYKARMAELLDKPSTYGTHPFRLKIEGRALPWPE